MATISMMGIPAILKSAESSLDSAASQFALIYRIGYVTQPPSTLMASLAFGGVAWRYWQTGNPVWQKWAAAGSAMAVVLPWTFGLMEPTSHKLLRIAGVEAAEASKGEDKMKTKELLLRWSKLNAIRSIGPLVAGGIGLWIALDD